MCLQNSEIYGQEVDGCNQPHCCSKQPRCPVCNFTFVEEAHQICHDCGESFKCENCENLTPKAFTLPPSTYKLQVQIMGTGVTTDQCKSCKEYRVVGENRICEACATKEESHLVCYDCFHFSCPDCGRLDLPINGETRRCASCESLEDWEEHLGEDPNYIQDLSYSTCKLCDDVTDINTNGICKTCYEERSKIRKCTDCFKAFKPKHEAQVTCLSCTPRCLGCEAHVFSNNKGERFCNHCRDIVDSGRCIECHNYDIALDYYGRCTKHSRAKFDMIDDSETRHFCVACDETEVPNPRAVCQSCTSELEVCIDCGEDKIRSNRLCNSCYDASVLKFELNDE